MQTPDGDGDLCILPATTDDLIFGYLSPADLLSHSRTCQAIHDAVSSFYRRAFRIETTLRRFFTPSEVIQFRELQAVTGMVISGSVALDFFDRTEYADSSLDLYVNHQFRQPIALWLQSIGYKFLPRPALGPKDLDSALKDGAYNDGVEGYPDAIMVLVFVKFKNRLPKIQLITSSASPLSLVLELHSTCVMNLITSDKAYSIFPRATFEERRSLIFVNKETDFASQARAKYEERGWSFIEACDVQQQDPISSFAKGPRYLGDSNCWSITLHPEYECVNGTCNWRTWESNSWELQYKNGQAPEHVWTLMRHPKLHWTYLICLGLFREGIPREVYAEVGENRELSEKEANVAMNKFLKLTCDRKR